MHQRSSSAPLRQLSAEWKTALWARYSAAVSKVLALLGTPPPWTQPRIPGLRRFFRLPSAERDVHALVDDEIAFHVDTLAEELAAEGLLPDAARREALRRFSNLHGIRYRCFDISGSHATDMRRHELLSNIWQDIVHTTRGIRPRARIVAGRCRRWCYRGKAFETVAVESR